MTQISEHNANRFEKLKAWLARDAGRAGKARLIALGVPWPRGNRPDLVVAAMAEADQAPPLPPLEAFRDKMSFTCGACWALALIANRSSKGG